MTRQPIRVLIVDDSASVRQVLSAILDDDPGIEVMGTAADVLAAVRRLQNELPDVMILDIEMPGMDGLTFLRKIMVQRPIPVIICSTLTEAGSQALFDALEAGAVDVLPKPRIDTRNALIETADRLRHAVRAAAQAKLRPRQARAPVEQKLTADVMMPPPVPGRVRGQTERIVCIGISTGGTETLREVLTVLPPTCPGIAVVQHMPEKFTAAFARRLNGLCTVEVKEAEDGDELRTGRVLIAPGNRHMLLQRSGTQYRVAIKDGPQVSRHRPSVDVLFRSAAQYAGANALGLIMTGMGDDGARGLLEMRKAGACTLAQDEESCVVFGMPKEAIELGAAQRIVRLARVPHEIMAWLQAAGNSAAEPRLAHEGVAPR
ncbi:MAG: chemotaxis response regulator protein-glutamate methylesterase [Bosea sp.]|uniref:protein-glutamate methylesterase/protein-glutamine glutaminase n=1 Tax=Bosea sp. (in: a-proteobacteria) TaxID=1871050 RepID=UPI001ACE5A6E|nr:chemotaxis response regulator protein-glutamate methylesterase [Bosea sp. (in: a-proteobacteria)]MBN9451381.1 chemotaxis response regulator protein-glutamate methylesterase [Bosea sp. (in: a-proteobacteria)]